MSQSQPSVCAIGELSPYVQRGWTIRARVIDVASIQSFQSRKGTGKLLSVDLVDEHNTAIRAKFWNDEADKWGPKLHKGSVYFFGDGRVTVANRRFNNLPHPYELSFDSSARITECTTAEADGIPNQRKFNYMNIRDIRTSSRELPFVVDILGIVKAFTPATQLVSKRTQQPITRRGLTVVDDSGHQMDITLWNEKANIEDSVLEGNPVVSMLEVSIRDYQGRQGQTGFSSQLDFHPDSSPAKNLKSWFERFGATTNFKSLTEFQPSDAATRTATVEATVDAIQRDSDALEVLYYSCFARVERILGWNNEKKLSMIYYACPTCRRKVNEVDSSDKTGRCENCSKTVTASPRYMFPAVFTDLTNSMLARCFHDQGLVMLNGLEPSVLHQWDVEGNHGAIERLLSHEACWKPYRLRVRSKTDEYQGVRRRNLTITSIDPIDYDIESRRLLAEINEMLPGATSISSSRKSKLETRDSTPKARRLGDTSTESPPTPHTQLRSNEPSLSDAE